MLGPHRGTAIAMRPVGTITKGKTMTRTRQALLIIAGGFIFVVSLACGTSGEGSTSTSGPTEPAPADGLTAVPNSDGLRARVPEGVTPNGLGGAAGFHTDDRSFSMTLREDSTSTIAQARETAQMLGSLRFVRNDETPDGYVVVYEARTLDDQGSPTSTPVFQVDIRRNIGATSYVCNGSGNTEARATQVVDSCLSVVGGG